MTGSISQLERLTTKQVGAIDGLGEEQGRENRTSCVIKNNHWQTDKY